MKEIHLFSDQFKRGNKKRLHGSCECYNDVKHL